jgi:hypothetical protein
MSKRDLDPSQYGEADRREVDPMQPHGRQAGNSDWWVKEHRPCVEWWGRYAVQTAANDGSRPPIFVPPRATDRTHGSYALRPRVGGAFQRTRC